MSVATYWTKLKEDRVARRRLFAGAGGAVAKNSEIVPRSWFDQKKQSG